MNKGYSEDVELKLESYKKKLNKDLLVLLNNEKTKDNQREKLYQCTEDADERKRLQILISNERIESSERILQFNQ